MVKRLSGCCDKKWARGRLYRNGTWHCQACWRRWPDIDFVSVFLEDVLDTWSRIAKFMVPWVPCPARNFLDLTNTRVGVDRFMHLAKGRGRVVGARGVEQQERER